MCLIASSILLCKGCEKLGLLTPYAVVCTMEGIKEDVHAELAQIRAILQDEGITENIQLDTTSGSDVWADWIGKRSANTIIRMGIAPKDLAKVLTDMAPILGSATSSRLSGSEKPEESFMADLQSGIVYLQNTEVEAVRKSAKANNGYAVIISGPDNKQHDVWGHAPEGLELMRGLKSRWDKSGLFNLGAFIV